MIDVFVSPEEVQVAGGPSEVEVDLDFGSQGPRGSNIFVGPGKPGPLTLPSDIALQQYDLYINVSEADSEYSYLYQYSTSGTPGVFEWIRLFRVAPETPSLVTNVLFSSGSGEFMAPLSEYFTPEYIPIITSENISITYSIENENPIASSISSVTVVDGDIIIDFTGIEYSSGSWSNLSGNYKVSMTISYTLNIDES